MNLGFISRMFAGPSDGGIMAGLEISIPDERYASDIALHDRFLQFSSDLLKLGLGGIAVTGFLLTLFTGKDSPLAAAFLSDTFEDRLMIGVGLFSLSAAAAMVHRFLAADGMYHHLRAIKLLIALSANLCADDRRATFRKEVRKDEKARNWKFGLSEAALMLASAMLVAGALSTGLAFVAGFRSAAACAQHGSARSAIRE